MDVVVVVGAASPMRNVYGHVTSCTIAKKTFGVCSPYLCTSSTAPQPRLSTGCSGGWLVTLNQSEPTLQSAPAHDDMYSPRRSRRSSETRKRAPRGLGETSTCR